MKFTVCSMTIGLVALTTTTMMHVQAFVTPLLVSNHHHVMSRLFADTTNPSSGAATTTTTTTTSSVNGVSSLSTGPHAVADESAPIIASLKELLEHLDDGKKGGIKLWQASSRKWQDAIRQAVGAPATADDRQVARALYDAMVRPHNQFALLVGGGDGGSGANDEPKFHAVFPSEAVLDHENKTCWVEVQLRAVESDDLLVTMGVNLVQEEQGGGSGGGVDCWKIDELQWQDFRDAYYPGLSGREWLRAF